MLAAQRGYAVAVNYLRDRASAESVVDRIRALGGRAEALQADVSSEAEVVRLFAEVDKKLGPITALVNNAGILERQMRVEEMDAARWNRVLATNVTGSFLCAREAVRRMSTKKGGKGGAIVNISSAASRLGSPGEYVDYAASKAAVDALHYRPRQGGRRRRNPGELRAAGSDLHLHPRKRWRARARGSGKRRGADEARRPAG